VAGLKMKKIISLATTFFVLTVTACSINTPVFNPDNQKDLTATLQNTFSTEALSLPYFKRKIKKLILNPATGTISQ
jgi:hypothetical protein